MDEDEDDEDDDQDDDEKMPSVSVLDPSSLPSRSKPSTTQAAAAAAASAQHDLPAPLITPGECPHCDLPSAKRICGHCGLRTDKHYSDPQNCDIRDAQRRKLDAASKVNTLRTDTTLKHTLSRHEIEYERIAQDGPTYPLFAFPAACSVSEAFAQIGRSYMATDYEIPPSASIIKLIQSGKTKYPAWLVPKRVMEEEITKNGDTLFKVASDGKVTTTQQLVAKPIVSLEQLMEVYLCAIVPALIENTRALMDWTALVRSVQQLSRTHSWSVAQRYLTQTLVSKINARVPFGDFDHAVLSNALASESAGKRASADNSTPAVAPASSESYRSSAVRNPPSSLQHHRNQSQADEEEYQSDSSSDEDVPICADWNWKGICTRTPCRYRHQCKYYPHCGSEALHQARFCSYSPSSSTPEVKNEGINKAKQ